MDDDTLNRLAIEEIVREINEAKARELKLPVERKLNPLVKPNKNFLGRTINSVLTHNKRQTDIKRENCRKKLRDLDDRAQRRLKNNYFRSKEVKERSCRVRSKSQSSRFTMSSSSESSKSSRSRKSRRKLRKKNRSRSKSRKSSCSSDDSKKHEKKKKKNKLKRKTKKRKSKSKRRSSHSSTEANGRIEHSPHRRYKDYGEEEEVQELIEHQYTEYPVPNSYEEANIHYSQIAAAYNQMQQLYQYSSMLATVASANLNTNTCLTNTTIANESIENANESPNLSPTSSSSKSTSLSISLSSLEEDENGVLTINVSSDNEDNRESKPARSRLESADDSAEALILSASSDSSHDAENACINLESESGKEPCESSEDSDSSVAILSCSSVSEKNVEKEEEEPLLKESFTKSDSPKAMIDLTEE